MGRDDSLVLTQDCGHCSWWALEACKCWESDVNTSLMVSKVLRHCWALQTLCCQQVGVLGWILWHPRIQMFLHHLTEISQVQSLPSLQLCQSRYGNITGDLTKVDQYSVVSSETFWIQLIYMLSWCTCQCWFSGWICWPWRAQFGQAQFSLSEAVMAVLDRFSVLHMPRHCCPEDLLQGLPWHRGKTHCSIVPWVSLSTPFIKSKIISFDSLLPARQPICFQLWNENQVLPSSF